MLSYLKINDHSKNSNVFLLTSSVPSEGKSFISSNLALSFAANGEKVLLLDGDLRLPNVAKSLQLKNESGVLDHILGDDNIESYIVKEVYPNLDVLPSGGKAKNPTAKIIVADPKPKFSKMGLFQEGWGNHYSGMIDWIGSEFGGGNVSVDPDAMTVTIDGEVTKVDACNVIPAMKAGRICEIAGITEGNWAPVSGHTMQSRIDENIHVLGDASAQGDMPKSGYSANSQAKVAAMAVRGALTGSKVFPAKFSNICWSLVDTNDGVKVGATYEATDEKIAKIDGFVSKTGESADLRKATYEESIGWYSGITADMFG